MSAVAPAVSRAPVPSDAEILSVLHSRFGHGGFRDGQMECIRRTVSGQDQLMVLPTGGGKSLLYQLPACLLPGTTLVVSPLVALMEDQLRGMRRNGIPAECLHSGQTAGLQAEILDALETGRLKVLLAAPERLTTSRMQRSLSRTQVSLVAVDEAHCVSEWGHDFRPDYRQLQPLLKKLRAPVLAITATATEEVQDDICASLGIPAALRTVLSVDRGNLRFGVQRIRGEAERLDALAGLAERLIGGCGLVYVTTRREADDLAFRLCRRLRQRVTSYHAGLPAETRLARQTAFLRGELPLMVATSAFGMGIDKPDVRLVVHARPPRSLEDYVQEAGRASRDGKPAVCCLLAAPGDFSRLESDLHREGLPPDRVELRLRRIRAMQGYALGRRCRRAAILDYFSAAPGVRPATCCDRCHRWRWGWLLG